MTELFINNAFRDLIPTLSEDERAELEASIINEGNRVPIDTWNGYIIDGHNRYDICKKHNIPLKPANEVKLEDEQAVMEWIIRNQFGRRNLHPYSRSVLALKLEDIIRDKAKRNQLSGLKQYRDAVPQKSAERSETRQELAKVANVSHDTIAKVKVIEAHATPQQKANLISGKVSINKVYNTVKQNLPGPYINKPETKSTKNVTIIQGDMVNEVPKLGKFDLIIADPPYNVTDFEWDKIDDFIKQTEIWLTICKQSLSDKWHLFWFCSPAYAADIEMVMRKLELPIKSRIVWHRRNMSMGSQATSKFIDSWEMIFHCGNTELNMPEKWDSTRFDVQTFAVPQTNFNDKKIHPTQKPIELLKWLIRYASFDNSRILDPFAGSGTTGAACNGNECILIERDAEYFNSAKQRLGIQ
jgi:DNA modification methylase